VSGGVLYCQKNVGEVKFLAIFSFLAHTINIPTANPPSPPTFLVFSRSIPNVSFLRLYSHHPETQNNKQQTNPSIPTELITHPQLSNPKHYNHVHQYDIIFQPFLMGIDLLPTWPLQPPQQPPFSSKNPSRH
jgi:hypothetical protein